MMHRATLHHFVSAVLWTCLICCIPFACAAPVTKPAIIPAPVTIELQGGTFAFDPDTHVYLDADDSGALRVGEYLSGLLSSLMGRKIPVHLAPASGQRSQSILLSMKGPAELGSEGYELVVHRDRVHIRAAKPAGLFYAVQTLRQMLPPEREDKTAAKTRLAIPRVVIWDKPRFAWRGLLLDCSRTFLTIDYLKRSIDSMALYKLNVLQLHLTDDQGWRVEIKKHPRLTGVASRFADRFGGSGGYYSQKELRDLIAYAKERNVTIVPEIELPGHSMSVLAAYPDLACPLPNRLNFEVCPFHECAVKFWPPLCAGNERVFEVCRDILAEVAEVFPAEFIHVGGDEVVKNTWQECPKCRERMRKENIKSVDELQSFFMKRVGRIVAASGRRVMGWDEILDGGLDSAFAVMSWRGAKGGIAAAKLRHDVVMTPNTNCYFDFSYVKLPTERVYAYDPIPKELNGAEIERILGVQGCMWTHVADTEKAIDYQIYPRLLALAEVAWSPQAARKWSDFANRLNPHFRRFESLGITHFRETPATRKVKEWQASEVAFDRLFSFDWDLTRFIARAGEYEIQVRRESGQERLHVKSVTLLKNGREVNRYSFPSPLRGPYDVMVAWLPVAEHTPGARYTLRVSIQGMKVNDVAGSVWITPLPARENAVRP